MIQIQLNQYTWDSKMAALNLSNQGDHYTCASLNKDGGYVVFGFMCSLIAFKVNLEG